MAEPNQESAIDQPECNPAEVRVHVIYHGTVQGVGFRRRAQHFARKRGVSGFVRNLPNGTVELTVEGQSEAVDRLLADIGRVLGGFISHAEVERSTSVHEFIDFDILR